MRDARAVEPLIAFLSSEDDYLVRDAASALGKIGDPRAVVPLIELLRLRAVPEGEGIWSSDPRCEAATALGLIGDRRAVEPLLRALSDERDSLRTLSAIALGKLGDRRAIPALRKALASAKPIYHFGFAAALAQFGDNSGLPDLLYFAIKSAGISHGQFPALEAMEALGKLRDRRAVPALIYCLRSNSGWNGRGIIAASRALGAIGDRRALPALEAVRQQEDPAARKQVEDAIASFSAR